MSDLVIKHAGTTQTQGSQGPVSSGVALGQNGGIFVAGTTACTPPDGTVFCAIQIIEDAVFNSDATGLVAENEQKYPSSTGTGTDIDADAGTTTDGTTFSAGTTVYGRWTAFKLASGKVIAYLG